MTKVFACCAFFTLALLCSLTESSVAPLAAFPAVSAPYAAIAPYASSYSAHSINHALAAPYLAPAAPIIQAAPIVPAAVPAPVYPGLPFPYPYVAAANAW